jgi:hypothetical protein
LKNFLGLNFDFLNQEQTAKPSRAPLIARTMNSLVNVYDGDKDLLSDILCNVWSDVALTEILCNRIDLYKSSDCFFSKAFYDTLNLADTNIRIFDKNKELDLKDLLVFLPICNSIQDLSRFILDRLLSYGLFACQIYIEENTKGVNSLIIPPPWGFSWEKVVKKTASKYKVEEWKLKFNGENGSNFIDTELIIYQPLDQIYTTDGIYPVPPFKCALEPLAYYKQYTNAIRAILGKFGLHRQVYARINVDEFLRLYDSIDKDYSTELQETFDALDKKIREGAQSGILFLPPGTELKNVDAIEFPEAIAKMDTLLADSVFRGLRTTPSLMGRSETNQTTLSTVQKQIKLNEITSYQQKADSALKALIEKFFIYSDIKFEKIRIEREKTVLDTIDNQVKAELINNENVKNVNP